MYFISFIYLFYYDLQQFERVERVYKVYKGPCWGATRALVAGLQGPYIGCPSLPWSVSWESLWGVLTVYRVERASEKVVPRTRPCLTQTGASSSITFR